MNTPFSLAPGCRLVSPSASPLRCNHNQNHSLYCQSNEIDVRAKVLSLGETTTQLCLHLQSVFLNLAPGLDHLTTDRLPLQVLKYAQV